MAKELKYKLTLEDLFKKKMDGAIDSTKRMDSAMSGLGGKIAGVAAGLGIGAFAKELVTTGAKFDSYKARLETMLGSQARASQAFDQIKTDAAKTPFDVASLTEANAMLIGAGASADDARRTVMGLGNAITATGGGSDELSRMAVNLQQIKTLGKASAMDIKQFAFAGIPIYAMLAKTTGKTVEQVREMDVTYEQLQDSFDKAAAKGGMFYKGLEKQSATVGGQLSNLGDKFTNTMVGMYDRLKPLITQIIGYLSKTLDWVARNQETIIFMGKVLAVVGAAVLAYKAWSAATLIMETAQLALNTAMTLNPVGAVIAGVTALVLIYAQLYNNMKSVEELHNASTMNKQNESYNAEVKQIDFLAKKYESLGRSKEQAQLSAIKESKANLAYEYANVKNQLANAKTPEETRIAQSRLADLAGKNKAIDEISGIAPGSGTSAKAGSSGKGDSTGLGSSTEVSSVRPQSLVINIHDGLIKSQTIIVEGQGADMMKNFKEKVKQWSAEALLEATSDANLAAR